MSNANYGTNDLSDLGHARKSGVHSRFGPKPGTRKTCRKRSHKLDRAAGAGLIREGLADVGLDAADMFLLEHDSMFHMPRRGVIELDLDDEVEPAFDFLGYGTDFGRDTYGIGQCKHFLVSREDDGFLEWDHIEGDAK